MLLTVSLHNVKIHDVKRNTKAAWTSSGNCTNCEVWIWSPLCRLPTVVQIGNVFVRNGENPQTPTVSCCVTSRPVPKKGGSGFFKGVWGCSGGGRWEWRGRKRISWRCQSERFQVLLWVKSLMRGSEHPASHRLHWCPADCTSGWLWVLHCIRLSDW